MIIIDPVAMGDATCSRATPATYWDRTGVLRTAGPNELRVTYDPSDLSTAPYALIERQATNNARRSDQFSHPVWDKNGAATAIVSGPDGSMTAIEYLQPEATSNFAWLCQGASGDAPDASLDWVYSFWVRVASGETTIAPVISNLSVSTLAASQQLVDTKWRRVSFALRSGQLTNTGSIGCGHIGIAGQRYQVWGPQLERGAMPTSYIPNSTDAPATRAADLISAEPGLLYSNVPEAESLWVPGNYVKGARVRDAAHVVFEALVDNASGPLTDTSSWLKLGPTNRWAMLDERNNTQTVASDEIVFVVSPRAISQGVFLGNMDATEVRVSMVDQSFGLVYSEVANQIVSTSGSSFYRWCFNRIRRRSYFLTSKMPVFANPLITIAIRKDGSQPKCGMCMVGPAVDVGLSEYGLSTELKDYSTTTFNVDGTSSTMKRGYSKRMSVDLSVKSELVEGIEEQLISYRQKTVVWIGATFRGDAILCGKYSSFKKVIESYPISKMALQIEGVVS